MLEGFIHLKQVSVQRAVNGKGLSAKKQRNKPGFQRTKGGGGSLEESQ